MLNLIAIVGSFLPVWLFSRSDSIWAIFKFLGCQRDNKISKLETKFSGATSLSQIFLDQKVLTVTIPHQNQLTKIELSSKPTINVGNSSPAKDLRR